MPVGVQIAVDESLDALAVARTLIGVGRDGPLAGFDSLGMNYGFTRLIEEVNLRDVGKLAVHRGVALITLPMVRVRYCNANLLSGNNGGKGNVLLSILFTLFKFAFVGIDPGLAVPLLDLIVPDLARAMIVSGPVVTRDIAKRLEGAVGTEVNLEPNVLIGGLSRCPIGVILAVYRLVGKRLLAAVNARGTHRNVNGGTSARFHAVQEALRRLLTRGFEHALNEEFLGFCSRNNLGLTQLVVDERRLQLSILEAERSGECIVADGDALISTGLHLNVAVPGRRKRGGREAEDTDHGSGCCSRHKVAPFHSHLPSPVEARA